MFDGPSWPEAILVPSLSRLKKETVCTSMFMASVLCYGTSIKQVESTKVILRKVLIAKVVGRTQELTFAPVRCTIFLLESEVQNFGTNLLCKIVGSFVAYAAALRL